MYVFVGPTLVVCQSWIAPPEYVPSTPSAVYCHVGIYSNNSNIPNKTAPCVGYCLVQYSNSGNDWTYSCPSNAINYAVSNDELGSFSCSASFCNEAKFVPPIQEIVRNDTIQCYDGFSSPFSVVSCDGSCSINSFGHRDCSTGQFPRIMVEYTTNNVEIRCDTNLCNDASIQPSKPSDIPSGFPPIPPLSPTMPPTAAAPTIAPVTQSPTIAPVTQSPSAPNKCYAATVTTNNDNPPAISTYIYCNKCYTLMTILIPDSRDFNSIEWELGCLPDNSTLPMGFGYDKSESKSWIVSTSIVNIDTLRDRGEFHVSSTLCTVGGYNIIDGAPVTNPGVYATYDYCMVVRKSDGKYIRTTSLYNAVLGCRLGDFNVCICDTDFCNDMSLAIPGSPSSPNTSPSGSTPAQSVSGANPLTTTSIINIILFVISCIVS